MINGKRSLVLLALAGMLAILAWSCSSDDNPLSPSQGQVSVYMHDQAAGLAQAWVEVSAISIRPVGGQHIEYPLDTPVQEDLLTHVGAQNSFELLVGEPLAVGDYDQICVTITEAHVITDTQDRIDVVTPPTTVVGCANLPATVSLDAEDNLVLTIDFDVAGSFDLGAQPGLDPLLTVSVQ